MTRALLLLTGGRGLPDMLFVKYMVKYWTPDYIFLITTNLGEKTFPQFEKFTRTYFEGTIEKLDTIDPFSEEHVKARCDEAFKRCPDAEWVVHFTSSPKAVGIYAYEIMKEKGYPFYFLDTDGKRAVALPSKNAIDIDTKKLYHATVEEYMSAYGRIGIEEYKDNSYHVQAQKWYSIAELFLEDYNVTMALLAGVRRDTKRPHLEPIVPAKAEPLIRKLRDLGFLAIESQTTEYIECNLLDDHRYNFIKGGWLEVYVWHQIHQEHFADDLQWGHPIRQYDPTAEPIPASNELDIAFTSNAKLLIGECKTSAKPFASIFLDKLNSIAHLVGMGYVRQVFITNHPRPDEKDKSFNNFRRQAKVRGISIITGDQLPKIGQLLKKEIADPDRSK